MDKDSGLVHTVKATAANVHDVSETSKLLTGEKEITKQVSYELHALRAIKIFFKDFN